MAGKTTDESTKASAVELDEGALDRAQGGATYDFAFKFSDPTIKITKTSIQTTATRTLTGDGSV